ncbi:sensor histidine kinase [Streptomyces poonensis]|uniref:histidine kinase n=1 Tax=Streptomyces poonensis TaxID=68255 RepID=A0A918PPF2_9ACTN|nr:HAMP domain-containing sensor histidine kinase [Streptomyces poonensis]GGZ17534.1 two-component sensor histidine kinase [Streptomyces poonensis]GLJ90954.1 two-component sensor histidine kinase [Streptomyces poonensis]
MRTPRLPRALSGLRVRLVVAFALVAAVATVTTGALTFREARTGILQQSQDTVIDGFRDRVDALVPNYRFPPARSDLQSFATDVASGRRSQNWRVLAVYRDLSATSAPGDAFEELSPEMRDSVRSRRATVFQRVSRDGRSALVVGMPVTFADATATSRDASGLEVYLTVPQGEEQGYVDALVTAAQRATVPALGLAVLLALLAARQVLRPVRALRRATRDIAEGRLDTRLTVRGSDELAELSRSFNETAAALEESVAELRRMEAGARRFAADVSHELRTPLAAMSAVTDVLDEDAARLDGDTAMAVRLISEETTKLAGLVDDLMEISRFDAGAAALHLNDIDLAESVRRTLASRGWADTVETRLPEPGALRGRADPRRLDVVVANLVANAFRHGAPPVRLRLHEHERNPTDATGRQAVIEVADSGKGIPDSVLPHVFDRFYKSDTARTRSEGSGLGLAITAENVRLHGGTVRAANRPGGGAVFTVVLPLRHDDAEAEHDDAHAEHDLARKDLP